MARAVNLGAQGSSTTEGALGGTSYIEHYAAAHPSVTFNNLGTSGFTYEDMTGEAATVDALLVEDAINILTIQWGSNDSVNSLTHASLLALPTYCKARRLAGWIVGLVTQLPRSDATFNTRRNTYLNPTIRNQITLGNADFLIDWASDATIGIDAAGSDTDIIGDGTHPAAATHVYGNTNYVEPALALLTRPRYLLNW